MKKTIFISNLSPGLDEEQIRELFIRYGEVHSLNLITHHKTGKSKGVCFVDMNPDDADTVIKALDGKDFKGQKIYLRLLKEEERIDTVEL